MDLVSVIVPIYNVEAYLIRCVDSIRNQTYSNLEIILVDDGSPDRCPQMCDAMMAQDARIQAIHKENAGLGMARNDGMGLATGKYVTFVDPDDWISPTHIEHLHRELAAEEADAALGNHIRVGADGERTLRKPDLSLGIYEGQRLYEEITLRLIGADVGEANDVLVNSSVSMNLYKMDVIRRNHICFGSERDAVAEDFFFNWDFFHCAQRVVYTDEAGYYYFQNGGSISKRYDPKRFDRTLNYYSLCREKAERYKMTEDVGLRIERSFLMKIRVAIRSIVLSDLPKTEKLRQIQQILTQDTVKSVLRQYPIGTYLPAMELFARLMRGEHTRAVYALMLLRETGRKSKPAKTILHRMGIGR